MTDRTDTYNAEALTARWSAVANDEIGGWAVTTNGLGPLNGGRMAADLVMTQEIAEHIAEVHNKWLAVRQVTVSPSAAFVGGERYELTPITVEPVTPEEFVDRYQRITEAFDNTGSPEV